MLIFWHSILTKLMSMVRPLSEMLLQSIRIQGAVYGLSWVIILRGRGSLIEPGIVLKRLLIALTMLRTLGLFSVLIANLKRKWLRLLLMRKIGNKLKLSKRILWMKKFKPDFKNWRTWLKGDLIYSTKLT